jgi:hypothetical protein
MVIDVNNPENVNLEASQTQESGRSGSDKELNFRRLEKKAEALEQAILQRDAMLDKQQKMLEQMQARFLPQDRDEIDSLPDEELIDNAKFKRVLQKEREHLRKEAEEIARQTYQRIDSENYVQRLQSKYPDYDRVVNASNAEKLQEIDPDYVALLGEVKDEFKRRELAYKRIEKIIRDEKPKAKAQDVVTENRQAAANFFTPQGQAPMMNPHGFDFDVRSKEARTKAYERLKAAQKRG